MTSSPDPAHEVVLRAPTVADGAALWRLAEASGGLDLNSPYAYLLWCRDFAEASVVATLGGVAVGYVIGFVRPAATDTLFVWQITVAPDARGRGLAAAMLDHLAARLAPTGVGWLEASVTPGNEASWRTFARFADRRGAATEQAPLFDAADFPTPHDPEVLVRIGPFERSSS